MARGDGGKEWDPTGSFGDAALEKTEVVWGQDGPPMSPALLAAWISVAVHLPIH